MGTRAIGNGEGGSTFVGSEMVRGLGIKNNTPAPRVKNLSKNKFEDDS